MTDRKRVVVLLSGNGSTLQAILDQQPGFHYEVVGVFSNRPGVEGLNRADRAGIPTRCIDHQQFPDRASFDQAMMLEIEQLQPDLLVLAGYMRILTTTFVERFQGKMINTHPSLLPKHKGMNTHRAALESGDSHHGATVHFVTEELDSGGAILQASLTIHPDDSAESLEQRVKTMEQVIYPVAIDWCVTGRITIEDSGVYLDNQPLTPQGYLLEEHNLEPS
ncbi:MAG: phosphoribosylglycinamide formyltransferase [Endozoicomonas sp.]